MLQRENSGNIILILLILLENLLLFFFYKTGITGPQSNAIMLSSVSMLIGIVLIAKYYGVTILDRSKVSFSFQSTVIPFMLFALGMIWVIIKTLPIYKFLPIDPRMSDIVPSIEVLVSRFLHSQNPYAPTALAHFGYPIPSTYLPMHWLPYCIAELLHIDYRWIAFGIWSVAVAIITRRAMASKTIVNMVALAMLFSAYFLITDKTPTIIGCTIEIMVAGYYMMLICALNSKNAILLGISIGICLLSRYSIVLWLPLYAFILFFSGNKKALLLSAAVAACFVIVIYIIPFLSKDWSAFYTSYSFYQKNAINEWYHLDTNGLPMHLFEGVGFAQFFYTPYLPDRLVTGYNHLKSVLFISLLSVNFLMGLWYWFNKGKIHYKIFLLASLKIYFTVFFAFIMVPYEYLVVVGNFVSIAIFAEQLRYKVQPAK